MAERVKLQRARVRENGNVTSPTSDFKSEHDAWGSPVSSPTVPSSGVNGTNGTNGTHEDTEQAEKIDKGKEKEGSIQVKKFRGVPENVKLFEVFWEQVVQLIKVCVPSVLIHDACVLRS